MFTNAQNFAGRLTEVEKMRIRSCSEDRLKFLFHSAHRHEIDLPDAEGWKLMKEAKKIVEDQYTKNSAEMRFGHYWSF